MNEAHKGNRIAIVGTGFIATGAHAVIALDPRLKVTKILTRRDPASVEGLPPELLTTSLDRLLDESDIVFEATGDVIWATVVVERALAAGKKVVTMNSEFHVTTGSYFVGRGYLTESNGDQPGALAALHREAVGMGFSVKAFVNIKGFLNPTPTREDMKYWSEHQGLSLHETTSFTDGTKLQIEQALVANGLGGDIVRDGMIGGRVGALSGTDYLVEHAEKLGAPVSDYVLCNGAPPGVFLLATHPVQARLPHYGPYEKLFTDERKAYMLVRPYHLCALEVANSLRDAIADVPVLLDNSPVPTVSVAAVAKRSFAPGDTIARAIGGFDVRGITVRTAAEPDHVPIGLLDGARLRRKVEAEEKICLADVELRPSRAAEVWEELQQRIARSLLETRPVAPGPHEPSPVDESPDL